MDETQTITPRDAASDARAASTILVVLQIFSENTPANLERVEGVEMYRLLEHGYSIQMVETNDASISVDTPSDLIRVQERFGA